MKKNLAFAGLILTFAGIIIISIGTNTTSLTFKPEGSPEIVYNSWNISRTFEKGHKLTLSITTNPKWGFLGADFSGDLPEEFSSLNETIISQHINFIYLRVNVTDRYGGVTGFCILYFVVETSQPFLSLDPFAVAVSYNHGGLDFPDDLVMFKENNYLYLKGKEITGITAYRGEYKVNIWKDPELKAYGDPVKLELKSELVVKEHPYYFLVPLGGITIGIGTTTSIWGTKKGTGKIHKYGMKRKIVKKK